MTHGCAGPACQVCQLEQLVARSPLPRAQVLNALRDHHRRQADKYWDTIGTEPTTEQETPE